ncbi:hypothetical protein [Amycolatopsis sp. 195334CR]|uniref:hypothetical protein n=1 Tax=Amycolatopsis sp. 195334CR TaxID=2814588 RepID=UPI001A8E847A|nr:hypothetical protein [Amycolatopsis sp. 195334CR]MBN6033758.1 hypothetical protein [Amycolatopsis sp. 195334CR]
MQSTFTRATLALFALVGFVTGVWACFLPDSFYLDFPGFRSGWVSADGPFNEHLIRDVGAMFLALGVIAAGALGMKTTSAARLAGAAWLVLSVPHTTYHLVHLHVLEPVDQVLNAVGLVAGTLAALAVLLLPGKRRAPVAASAQ